MRNTSGLSRKERKERRKIRKATWKATLASYYVDVLNTSKVGIIYNNLQVRRQFRRGAT